MLAIQWLTMTIDGKIAVTAPLRMTTNENLTTTMAQLDVHPVYALEAAVAAEAPVQLTRQLGEQLGATNGKMATIRRAALAWVATVLPRLDVDTTFAL